MIKSYNRFDSICKQLVNKLMARISFSNTKLRYTNETSPDDSNLGLLYSNSQFCRLALIDSMKEKTCNSEKHD